MPPDLRPLKQTLLDEYGGFADKRIKNIDRGDRFIIDDRKRSDHGADGQLYGWFCSMFVTVRTPDELEMWIEDSVPMSSAVKDWFAGVAAVNYANGFRFLLNRGNYDALMGLADRIRAIVSRGARYDVPAYKYVAPRTANSLRRLHGALRRQWAR